MIGRFNILKKGNGIYNVANKNTGTSIKDMALGLVQKYSDIFNCNKCNRIFSYGAR